MSANALANVIDNIYENGEVALSDGGQSARLAVLPATHEAEERYGEFV
jgi:hypothetical protein